MEKTITITPYYGEELKKIIPEIAKLRMEVFREYPFLYEGEYEYEMHYLNKFTLSTDAICVVAMDGEKVVGISTGMPFSQEGDDIKAPFIKAHYNIEDFFYYGESVIKKEYRGLGIYHNFFKYREEHARKLNRFKYICFFTSNKPPNHPKRPVEYRPLNEIWEKKGFKSIPSSPAMSVIKRSEKKKRLLKKGSSGSKIFKSKKFTFKHSS